MSPRAFFSRRFLLVALASSALVAMACGPGSSGGDTGAETVLSAEQVAALDALPTEPLDLSATLLPNGQSLAAYAAERGITVDAASAPGVKPIGLPSSSTGPQQRKRDVITAMLLQATTLIGHTVTLPKGDEGTAQTRLGYSFGSRQPFDRMDPPVGQCGTVHGEIYGVDCSGMVYLMALNAGVDLGLPTHSGVQADPETWNRVLPPAWRLRMESVPLDQPLETGDIVYWPGHIGVVGTGASGEQVFVQSNGDSGQSADPDTLKAQCEKNLTASRGPRAMNVQKAITSRWPGKPVKVLRLVTRMDGTWTLGIRCAGQSSEAGGVPITLTDKVGTVSGSGSGTDYNGTRLTFSVEATYNATRSILTGILTTTTLGVDSAPRVDRFTPHLIDDDTGYFALTPVSVEGCPGEARLVRKPEEGPTAQ